MSYIIWNATDNQFVDFVGGDAAAAAAHIARLKESRAGNDNLVAVGVPQSLRGKKG